MPIIRFTEADKLASKVLDKGGYTVQLTACDQKASASQKSINFFTTLTLVKGPAAGKELNPIFNTETKSVSLLQNAQFFPARDLAKIAAAVQGIPFEQFPIGDIDTDTMMNKDFDIRVDIDTTSGDMINIITGFYPAGKATAAFGG